MSEADRTKWDGRYGAEEYIFGAEPRAIVREAPLPSRGRALDVACGEGQNAVFLAERGLDVEAVDISAVGLAKAVRLASARGLSIDFRAVDLETFAPDGPFDVIVCTHYLDRALFPKLEAALAPGGLLIGEWPLTLRSYPVAPDEPPRWFPSLRVLKHAHDAAVVQLVAIRG